MAMPLLGFVRSWRGIPSADPASGIVRSSGDCDERDGAGKRFCLDRGKEKAPVEHGARIFPKQFRYMFEIPASRCPGARVQLVVWMSLSCHNCVRQWTPLYVVVNLFLVVLHVQSAGVTKILESFWGPGADGRFHRAGGQIAVMGGPFSPVSQAAPANRGLRHGRSPVYDGLPHLAPITCEAGPKKISSANPKKSSLVQNLDRKGDGEFPICNEEYPDSAWRDRRVPWAQ